MMKSVDDAPYEIAAPIKEFWPQTEWDNAASISFLESGWQWDARNNSAGQLGVPCGTVIGNEGGVDITAEDSVGYFQINACNFPAWDPGTLYNARQNAGTAHALWADSGWQPWYLSAQQLGLL
jgi:hypothetical protein